MTDPADALKPASAEDVAAALVFALRFSGRKRVHNADELMSAIVAKSTAPRAGHGSFDAISSMSGPPKPHPRPAAVSSIKAMPAASIASLIRSPVLARPPIGPSVASSLLIVGTETPEKFAASS
jgi:hypothetical protein